MRNIEHLTHLCLLYALRFIPNRNIDLFVISVPVLFFSNIYCKINFMAKDWSDLCNFFSKLYCSLFFTIYSKLFFNDFKLLIFHNNIVKILEIMNKWNLLKTFCIKSQAKTTLRKISKG